MITMLIGGLWHGASWTFVIWGGLHGLFLVAERVLRTSFLANWRIWQTLIGRITLAALTFVLVCITWAFFRAESLNQALTMVDAMILPNISGMIDKYHYKGGWSAVGEWDAFITCMTMGSMLIVHWIMRGTTLENAVSRMPTACWALINAAMLIAIIMTPGEDRAFIYFQF